MQKLHITIQSLLLSVIDWFYPLFRRFMPLQTFRYAACGGFNVTLDISLFLLLHDWVFKAQNVVLPFITLKPHTAAFLVSFCITFPVGFYLSRYVVWQTTEMKKRVQLFRYFVVVLGCILLNYVCLNLFVVQWGWRADVAKLVTTVIVVLFSYLAQRNYSFKSAVNQ